MSAMLSSAEAISADLLRYSRQMALPQVGAEGQRRLTQARVLIIGAGGLGVPVSLYLAAAGIGQITLVDHDSVELSNLQRQVIFATDDVGRPKAAAAAARLRSLNDTIQVIAICEKLSLDNVEVLVGNADLVIDCCDNFPTRYLINDFCRALGKPWLFAAVHRFRGHFALFTPETACFRCLYPEQPVTEGNCSLAGVIGTVPGLMGLWQANEAIKYLLDLPESQPGQLWNCDMLTMAMKALRLTPDPRCWCGGDRLDPWQLYQAKIRQQEPSMEQALEISWQEWSDICDTQNGGLLIDVRGEGDHRLANAGGRWVPHEDIPQLVTSLNDDQIVALYCQRGFRSLDVVKELRERGFDQVYSISGGFERWSP